ncbi:hypothetical protein VP01_1742g2 [Puccinia sorghi]|uniref:Uncharacterized protein n=1 Tax=Puccinia sorghi TaxID=27349 RepID=A0A0L6VFR8_9BASI|nr:hypothetical protein VP01_1742g2 [Puccinia sorghi]
MVEINHRQIGSRVPLIFDLIILVSPQNIGTTKICLAFLRLVICHKVFTTIQGTPCTWEIIDRRLQHLGTKTRVFQFLFAELIIQKDEALFNGRQHINDIDPHEICLPLDGRCLSIIGISLFSPISQLIRLFCCHCSVEFLTKSYKCVFLLCSYPNSHCTMHQNEKVIILSIFCCQRQEYKTEKKCTKPPTSFEHHKAGPMWRLKEAKKLAAIGRNGHPLIQMRTAATCGGRKSRRDNPVGRLVVAEQGLVCRLFLFFFCESTGFLVEIYIYIYGIILLDHSSSTNKQVGYKLGLTTPAPGAFHPHESLGGGAPKWSKYTMGMKLKTIYNTQHKGHVITGLRTIQLKEESWKLISKIQECSVEKSKDVTYFNSYTTTQYSPIFRLVFTPSPVTSIQNLRYSPPRMTRCDKCSTHPHPFPPQHPLPISYMACSPKHFLVVMRGHDAVRYITYRVWKPYLQYYTNFTLSKLTHNLGSQTEPKEQLSFLHMIWELKITLTATACCDNISEPHLMSDSNELTTYKILLNISTTISLTGFTTIHQFENMLALHKFGGWCISPKNRTFEELVLDTAFPNLEAMNNMSFGIGSAPCLMPQGNFIFHIGSFPEMEAAELVWLTSHMRLSLLINAPTTSSSDPKGLHRLSSMSLLNPYYVMHLAGAGCMRLLRPLDHSANPSSSSQLPSCLKLSSQLHLHLPPSCFLTNSHSQRNTHSLKPPSQPTLPPRAVSCFNQVSAKKKKKKKNRIKITQSLLLLVYHKTNVLNSKC